MIAEVSPASRSTSRCSARSTKPGMRPARSALRGSPRTRTVADQRAPPGPMALTRTAWTPVGTGTEMRRGPGGGRSRAVIRPSAWTSTRSALALNRTTAWPKLTGGAEMTGGGGGACAITGTPASARAARQRRPACGG